MNKITNEYTSSKVILDDTTQKVEKTKKLIDLKVIILYLLLIGLFSLVVFFL